MTLDDIARRAVDGDRDALDSLVRSLQDDVCGRSLRMPWNREDAEAFPRVSAAAQGRGDPHEQSCRHRRWLGRVDLVPGVRAERAIDRASRNVMREVGKD